MAVKRYRVTGTQPVLGNSPQKTFEADLPPEQEGPLLASGAIQEVVVRHRDEKSQKQKEK